MPGLSQISPGSITVADNINSANPALTIALPSLLGAASGTGAVIESGARLAGGNVLTLATTGRYDGTTRRAVVRGERHGHQQQHRFHWRCRHTARSRHGD